MAKYKYETPYDRMNRENREDAVRSEYASQTRKNISKTKPGKPYYQPQDEAPDKAEIRAKAQGDYMKSQVGEGYQKDEGIFADTARTLENVMSGKRGKDAAAYGDPELKRGTWKAGNDAVDSQSKAEFKRESRGKADYYKKGGKVSSASSRADGCCVKGKTKGRMV